LNATAGELLVVGERGARFEGPMLGIGWHEGTIPCIVQAPAGVVRVRWKQGSLSARAVRVAPATPHEVVARLGTALIFWYVEPGAWTPTCRTAEAVSALTKKSDDWLRQVDPRHVVGSSFVREDQLDPRIHRALAALRDEHERSSEQLARDVGLSTSRFQHLFQQQMGVPVRRYRWWLRFRRAVISLRTGADLTAVAHASGFADSAHLSRVFRRSFGFPPSKLLALMSGTGR
jgi:transcriptional regulator GlxA family with amidase domain